MNLHGEALRDFHDGDVRAFTMRRTLQGWAIRQFACLGYPRFCKAGLSVITHKRRLDVGREERCANRLKWNCL